MNAGSLVRYDIRQRAFEEAALQVINAKKSPNTRDAYRRDLELWIRFCYALGVDPRNPGINSTTGFRDHLVNNSAQTSARRVLAALSSIYRVLLAGGKVAGNPFHSAVLAWPQVDKTGKTPAVRDVDAMAMLADAAKDADVDRRLRDVALLWILYQTGLRRASVARIARTNVRRDADGRINIRVVVKGDKERATRLPDEAAQALESWLAIAPSSTYVFPGRTGGHIRLSTINDVVSARARAIGANYVTPHCFRSAYITAGYDAAIPERNIQASAHHEDAASTRRYDRRERGDDVPDQIAEFRRRTR